MTEIVASTADVKQCPICFDILPFTEFGICRARKDGRNLYCKSCIRKKVTDSRRAQKAYKSIRQQYATQQVLQPETNITVEVESSPAQRQCVARQISKMTPGERVREAIRSGAKTQKEIAQVTRLGKDEIGDAIANLLLWTHEIRTEVIDNIRLYFINDVVPDSIFQPATNQAPKVPRRKQDVPSSFSSLQVLMPGKKNPEDEPEKIGSWVAA